MTDRVPPQLADAASPCIAVCVIDPATRWCLGCGRTLDEIAGWGAADAASRRAIRSLLPARMATLTLGASPSPSQDLVLRRRPKDR